MIPFAIKNLLNEERCFGGGQPCGLAAASAWGRRPPSAGGGPTKYHQLTFRNSLHQVGIRRQELHLKGRAEFRREKALLDGNRLFSPSRGQRGGLSGEIPPCRPPSWHNYQHEGAAPEGPSAPLPLYPEGKPTLWQ
jgi:hypothetical protein